MSEVRAVPAGPAIYCCIYCTKLIAERKGGKPHKCQIWRLRNERSSRANMKSRLYPSESNGTCA